MKLRSQRTREFRRLFSRLPAHVQQQIRASYRLFKRNPYDPRLNFERIYFRTSTTAPLYATRIGLRYRAVAKMEDDTLKWFFVGSHENYNKFL